MLSLDQVPCYLAQKVGLERPWWDALCAYYGVSPREALELGTRRKGRRPSLPGSPTCPPVSGKTWEEIWASHPRLAEDEIASFYREIGSWLSFRQVVYHRWRRWACVGRALPERGILVEYGCGIAPVSYWLATHGWARDRYYFLADVPSEHFEFAAYRLGQIECLFERAEIHPNKLPWLPACHVAVLLEVLEHVPNPLVVAEHVGRAIRPGGRLFESFGKHDDPHAADLTSAQAERDLVLTYLSTDFALESGRPWTDPDGGGVRRWRKR